MHFLNALVFVGCDDRSVNLPRADLIEQALKPGASDYPPGFMIEDDDQVPTAYIVQPVYSCSTVVLVESCLSNSIVTILNKTASGGVLGTATCGPEGVAAVDLQSPTTPSMVLQVIQEIDGFTSATPASVTPIDYVGNLPTPRLQKPIYQCGRAFLAEGTVLGAELEIENETQASFPSIFKIKEKSFARVSAWTTPIAQGDVGQEIRVKQRICPEGNTIESQEAIKSVEAEPMTIPAPEPALNGGSAGYVFGFEDSNKLSARSLIIGADIEFFDPSLPNPILTSHATWSGLNYYLNGQTIDGSRSVATFGGTPSLGGSNGQSVMNLYHFVEGDQSGNPIDEQYTNLPNLFGLLFSKDGSLVAFAHTFGSGSKAILYDLRSDSEVSSAPASCSANCPVGALLEYGRKVTVTVDSNSEIEEILQ